MKNCWTYTTLTFSHRKIYHHQVCKFCLNFKWTKEMAIYQFGPISLWSKRYKLIILVQNDILPKKLRDENSFFFTLQNFFWILIVQQIVAWLQLWSPEVFGKNRNFFHFIIQQNTNEMRKIYKKMKILQIKFQKNYIFNEKKKRKRK
jgi:hypothetical protein